MYKLAYFKATNVAGFMSGLGKKTFELDLRNMLDKDIITILGDNATGKSTFLSLIHPWHYPMDKRSKFILEGKEGTIIREYQGDDGTFIVSRCIYMPKTDGHSTKCYLKLIRGDNETELNPNGNVTSYYSLIYTYFGINSDYVNFAYYSDAITSIVKKSDTQRKLDVTNLIPNTNRLEIAYSTINDKYKELRNLMRNVSQKILSLNDEETIRGTLKRVEKDIDRFSEERETLVKKVAKIEGRLKEMVGDKDINDLLDQYEKETKELVTIGSSIRKTVHELEFYCKQLGITLPKDSITFDGIDKVHDNIRKFERRLDRSTEHLHQYEHKTTDIRAQLDSVEKELTENESILFSLRTQDIDELKRIRDGYQYRLDRMTYAKNKKKYENMSYDEAVSFINTLDLLSRMVQSLCDEYGQLFNDYFDSDVNDQFNNIPDKLESEKLKLAGITDKIDDLYHQIIEKEQYRKFQTILTKRPATCKDDTCPFIANALQWTTIEKELKGLQKEYEQAITERQTIEQHVEEYSLRMSLICSCPQLNRTIQQYNEQFKKFLDITIADIHKSFKNNTWPQIFDTTEMKKIAAVLSEKKMYEEIVTVKIPEIEHSIELAKTSESSKIVVENSCRRLRDTRNILRHELDDLSIHITTTRLMARTYDDKLTYWRAIDELINNYKESLKKQTELMETSSTVYDNIQKITELNDKVTEYKKQIKVYTDEIQELFPQREQLRFNLIQLDQLKTEKASIDMDFMIIEVMRSIVQPGKGLWKEAINIYMYDIRTIANQILVNMFDGNLYLNEFIITDKSFIIPFTHNGSEAFDISVASSSQQSTICMALSLAIISKLIDKYGIMTYDEVDAALSPSNKATFVNILASQMKFVGIRQCFIITHSPEYYLNNDSVGIIGFPGYKKITNIRNDDVIEVK